MKTQDEERIATKNNAKNLFIPQNFPKGIKKRPKLQILPILLLVSHSSLMYSLFVSGQSGERSELSCARLATHLRETAFRPFHI